MRYYSAKDICLRRCESYQQIHLALRYGGYSSIGHIYVLRRPSLILMIPMDRRQRFLRTIFLYQSVGNLAKRLPNDSRSDSADGFAPIPKRLGLFRILDGSRQALPKAIRAHLTHTKRGYYSSAGFFSLLVLQSGPITWGNSINLTNWLATSVHGNCGTPCLIRKSVKIVVDSLFYAAPYKFRMGSFCFGFSIWTSYRWVKQGNKFQFG